MSIKPVQTNTAASVQTAERTKVSKSATIVEETSVATNTTVDTSDAVTVSLGKSQHEPKGPPSHSYGAQHGRGATNFKKIDSNGDGVLDKEELLAAQEIRSGEGKNTKFIDRALENYDALTASSGKEGITKKEFYKPYRPATVETPPLVPTDPVLPLEPVIPTDTTVSTDSISILPTVETIVPSETISLDILI